MSGICFPVDDRPGSLHSFKFLYPDDICSFLLVAHSLSDSQLFKSRIVRLEDIFPPDVESPRSYIIGRKAPLEEGRGFLVTFDLQQMLVAHPLSAERQRGNGAMDVEESVADNIFIITVLQSEVTQFGVSYTVRDNYLVASADVTGPKGTVKRYSICMTPVFDEQRIAEENTLAAVWLPSVVPPLLVGLESLLMMGANAAISLPLKINAPKGYYKAPPPHLLLQLQVNTVTREGDEESDSCRPGRIIDLPHSLSHFATIKL